MNEDLYKLLKWLWDHRHPTLISNQLWERFLHQIEIKPDQKA